MDCTVSTETAGGVTLVSVVVANRTGTARRFRIETRLDGPLWAPRVQGVRAAGWDESGFEGTVAADDTRALGFASPAEPVGPPVDLVWSEQTNEPTSDPGPTRTAADLVRTLGDPRPPADVVLPSHLPAASDDAGASGP